MNRSIHHERWCHFSFSRPGQRYRVLPDLLHVRFQPKLYTRHKWNTTGGFWIVLRTRLNEQMRESLFPSWAIA
ncbi:hypothetical protein HBI56_112730 [Parastagonospora nodorum]|nr:hypothetical protein HBH53_132290 [Parastagonospora nodorum]KAH3973124.1 hypothetical protein HBH52_145170 [Parastagonospora nodorum]KAH4102218.1 hypothetical protein HBH46_131790 [Parastagonospora nodorum]KAH4349795.1 hypothetical protein HBH98_057030 [Parastagonospora nodorum]KAH4394866.1 hypothetical protein HBH97_024860 [Parastagonospora nodorum]